MAINNQSTFVRNGQADFFCDAMDVGSADPGGDCNVYTAGFSVLVAEMEFSATAFGAASAGVCTANAISDEVDAPASGTAAVLRLQDQDNATVAEGTVATSAADLILNTVSVTAGDTVAITAATITMPAG